MLPDAVWTLTRAYSGLLFLGIFSAGMGAAATTLVGINEIQDGGSYDADSRNKLKILSVITSGLVVLGTAASRCSAQRSWGSPRSTT